jgi:hypothetical protein
MPRLNEGSGAESADFDGEKLNLVRETRWSLTFASADGRKRLHRARVLDSSTITDLERVIKLEWASWTDEQRKDFCSIVGTIPDPPQKCILKFIANEANYEILIDVALEIAHYLPVGDALPCLVRCIDQSPPGRAINFIQALAWTKSPQAVPIIQQRLARISVHPEISRDDSFINWIAQEALLCIRFLIELRDSASNYRELAIGLLSEHACSRIRKNFSWYLAEYYKA